MSNFPKVTSNQNFRSLPNSNGNFCQLIFSRVENEMRIRNIQFNSLGILICFWEPFVYRLVSSTNNNTFNSIYTGGTEHPFLWVINLLISLIANGWYKFQSMRGIYCIGFDSAFQTIILSTLSIHIILFDELVDCNKGALLHIMCSLVWIFIKFMW